MCVGDSGVEFFVDVLESGMFCCIDGEMWRYC